MSVTRIAKLCRMCIKESHSFSYIYGKYISYDSQLFEVMNDVCHLDIQLNDGLPEFICSDCHDQLGEFLDFRMRSHECKAVFERLKKKFLEEIGQNKEGYEKFSGRLKAHTDGFGDQVNMKNEDVRAYMSSSNLEPVEAVESEDSRVSDEIAVNPLELDFEESEIIEVPEPQEEAAMERTNDLALSADRILRSSTAENKLVFKGNREKVQSISSLRIAANPLELDFRKSEIVAVPEPQEEAVSEETNDLALSEPRILCSSTAENELVLKGNGKKVQRISSLRAGEGGENLKRDGGSKGGIVQGAGKRYVCNKCRKSYSRKYGLQRHMIVHKGVKRIACEVCHKKFKTHSYIKTHMMLHYGEKPFECKLCQKRCKTKWNLKNHMLVHNSSKQFECKICRKGFHLKGNLNKHMILHFSEKPFPCDQCDMRFRREKYLSDHMRVHSGYRPFKCVECSKTFTRKHYLSRHMKVHTRQ